MSEYSLEKKLMDDLNICSDEKYFLDQELDPLKAEAANLLHRINGYIAYLRKRKASEDQ